MACIGVIAIGLLAGRAARAADGEKSAPEYGPAKGTLVIIGGGNAEGTGIMERLH